MDCTVCGIGPVRIQFDGQPLCMYCYNTAMAEEFGVHLPKLPKTFSADDENGVQRIF